MDLPHFECLTTKASSGSSLRSLGLGESQAERPEPHLQLQSSKDLVHKFIVAFDLFLGLMDLFAKLCRDNGERKQGHDLRPVADKYFFKVH